MTYSTVFSALDHPFRNLWFPAFGLIFVGIGLIWVLKPGLFAFASRYRFQRSPLLRWFFLLFGTSWTAFAFLTVAIDSWRAVSTLKSGSYSIVEGKVTDFRPMPYEGHASESFKVKNVPFAYSDYEVTAGFNNSASHGGPIREGLPVRISYREGEILKLEVAR